MKIVKIFVVVQFCFSFCCYSQNETKLLDNIEHSFKLIEKTYSVSCELGMKFHRRENGSIFFINPDSIQLDLDYFAITSLPFFRFLQTNWETTNAYYYWIINQNELSNKIFITKIEEDKNSEYIILKIADESSEFYRLLASRRNVFYSIKIFDKNLSVSEKLKKLRTIYRLNKNADVQQSL